MALFLQNRGNGRFGIFFLFEEIVDACSAEQEAQ